MKFSIVVRKKQKVASDQDLRKVILSIASIVSVIILSVAHMLIPVLGFLLVLIGILVGAVYLYNTNNIYSDTNYYHVLGDIDFDEQVIRINDEEMEYEEIGYDKMKQIKIFIGFFKNYTRESYVYNKVWDGISRIEFYVGEKQHKHSFIIDSEEEYIKFEILVMNLQSRYTIQTLDNYRRDNLKLPALIN